MKQNRTFTYVPTTKQAPKTDTKADEKVSIVPFVDSHVHIHRLFGKLNLKTNEYNSYKSNQIELIANQHNWKSKNKYVLDCVINVCTSPGDIQMCAELLSKEGIYGSWGIHPHFATTYNPQIESELEKWMSHPKTVAWGECGLDYHYNRSPQDVQREVFVKQIKMAVKHNKTLLIHSREAVDDTLAIMFEHVPKDWKIHFHCFTEENPNFAKTLLDTFPNLCIGFTGCITFNNSSVLRQIVSDVPLERMLLETDSPYMAPEGYRGKQSHPGHIIAIADFVAKIKRTNMLDVLNITGSNAKKLYGIDK